MFYARFLRPLALYSSYDGSRQDFFFSVGGNKNKNKISWPADVGGEKIKKENCQIYLIFSVKIAFSETKGRVSGADFSMSEEEIKKS